MMDEFAHLLGAGSTASSTELYDAATPAREEFGTDALVVQTSSPWDRHGQLWESFCRACAVDPMTEKALDPDFFTLQLPSWGLYRDWERAHTIPMWPEGPNYAAQRRAPIEFNDVLRRKEAANRDSFAREFRAQWRGNLSAYLSSEFVDRVFAPYDGRDLFRQTSGNLATRYAAHGDPSLSGANFGFVIAHLEHDENNMPHVVGDVVHHWEPSNFPDGIIDYQEIEDQILAYIKQFRIETLTFDQWNSAGSIQRLQTRADAAGLPYRTKVFKRDTNATYNWDSYEILKTAIGHDLVHLPGDDKLARAELEALQLERGKVTAPTTGPVRTKDIADSLANVVYTLIGENADALFDRLANLSPRVSNPGVPTQSRNQQIAEMFSRAGRRGHEGPGARRGDRHDPARGRLSGTRFQGRY